MRIRNIAAATALSLAGLAGCKNYLDAPKAVSDPNAPTQATRNQLYVGVLASTFGSQEGPLAMLVCEWMQQCAGVNGRFVDQQGTYGITNTSFDTPFASIYTAGGLIGIRAVQASADADGDRLYKGIAETIEAMDVMLAADVWGDIPYRQAVGDNP